MTRGTQFGFWGIEGHYTKQKHKKSIKSDLFSILHRLSPLPQLCHNLKNKKETVSCKHLRPNQTPNLYNGPTWTVPQGWPLCNHSSESFQTWAGLWVMWLPVKFKGKQGFFSSQNKPNITGNNGHLGIERTFFTASIILALISGRVRAALGEGEVLGLSPFPLGVFTCTEKLN